MTLHRLLDDFICANTGVCLYDKNMKIIKEPHELDWYKPYDLMHKEFYKKYYTCEIIGLKEVDEFLVCGTQILGIVLDYN